MTMNDTDVRAVLHRVTDHLESPAGLLDDVRRGGRRRVVRRRTLLTGGLAAVTAASVGGVLKFSGTGSGIQLASPLLDLPTRGDLASDQAYLRQLTDVWRRAIANADAGTRGPIHVLWAGTTPAGPAAFVAQHSADNPVVQEPDGWRLTGYAAFVEPTADGPRVMTIEQLDDSIDLRGYSQAALLGPDRDVLLVLDFGSPVEYSPELTYEPDGKVRRMFHRLVFKDGAAAVRVPSQRKYVTVAVSRSPVNRDNVVHVANASEIIFPGGRDRPAPALYEHTLPGAEQAWGPDPRARVNEVWKAAKNPFTPYVDDAGTHTHNGSPLYTIFGVTPDGRRLFLTTIQYDDDPARVVAVLGRDSAFTVGASGFVGGGALPVKLRLPDGQGVLVAHEGAALSYRAGDTGWRDAGRDAALLPAGATEVRVTPASGAASTVRL